VRRGILISGHDLSLVDNLPEELPDEHSHRAIGEAGRRKEVPPYPLRLKEDPWWIGTIAMNT
jgi:hypothetical protein